MTAEEKIIKIKEIFKNRDILFSNNYPKSPREEIKKEALQFTIAEIIDGVADIMEVIHDVYDVVED